MTILPAIDLLGGKCVRLAQGNFELSTEYSSDPISIAKQFQERGAKWLHVIDLDGARTGNQINRSIIEELVQTGMNLQVGGGIRSAKRAEEFLERGVARVVSGSTLVQDESFRRDFFALDGAVAGVDVRNEHVAIHGWENTLGLHFIDYLKELEDSKCTRFVFTDIETDGMQTGPNIELLKRAAQTTQMKTIASGGIGSIDHLRSIKALNLPQIEGLIVGRVIYEKNLDVSELILEADKNQICPD